MDIKINELLSTTSTNRTTHIQQGDETFKFTLISNIAEKDLQDKLSLMIDEIGRMGDRIKKHTDVKDMRKYRELIKSFLNEIVNRSHEFTRENFLDRRGRHRVYGIIKLIDKNLDDLAMELLKDEKDGLAILERVDEIRGLILDIIT